LHSDHFWRAISVLDTALVYGRYLVDVREIGPARARVQNNSSRHVNVAFVDDDVAGIDAGAVLDAPVGRRIGVAFGHLALDLDGAAYRIDDARKFDQQTVASGLDDAAAIFGSINSRAPSTGRASPPRRLPSAASSRRHRPQSRAVAKTDSR